MKVEKTKLAPTVVLQDGAGDAGITNPKYAAKALNPNMANTKINFVAGVNVSITGNIINSKTIDIMPNARFLVLELPAEIPDAEGTYVFHYPHTCLEGAYPIKIIHDNILFSLPSYFL